MSSNHNKNTMCNVCGKVMGDDLLKRHVNLKHSNTNIALSIMERNSPSVSISRWIVNIKQMMKMKLEQKLLRLKSRVTYC